MKTSVSSKTLTKAFENDENFKQFINDFTVYFDYVLIMSMTDPDFELTFEEFINKRNNGNS